MPSLYAFAEYSADWPQEFQLESDRLQALLGETLIDVHHIGSTSVPGLAAKPIIDLLPIVADLSSLDQRSHQLVQAGYKSWGEYGISGRRYFSKDRGDSRTHNLHFFPLDHPDVERHLAFRDYLRCHDDTRREYETLKRRTYAEFPHDIGSYNDGKDAWIKLVEKTALDWYRRQ